MTHRMPWGSYHASLHIDTKPPFFFWTSIPWLGIGLLKIWPLKFELNWPVTFEVDDK